MLAFQAKCQPQETQSARVRRYATDSNQLLKTVTIKLARLEPGLRMCAPAKTREETIVANVGPMASINRWKGYPRKATSSASDATASSSRSMRRIPSWRGTIQKVTINPPIRTMGRMLATSMPQPSAAPKPNSRGQPDRSTRSIPRRG